MTTSVPSSTASQQHKRVYSYALVDGVKRIIQKKWLQTVIRAGVTVGLFAILFRSISWPVLLSTLIHARHGMLLLGLAVGGMCIIFSTYSWRSLVLAERIPADLSRLINLYLVGMAFSHFLPTSMGGDAVKAYYVGRESDNVAGATSAVVMSRIVGFISMLLISLPVLLVWHSWFTNGIITSFLLLSILIVAMIVIAILVSAQLHSFTGRFLKGTWARHRSVVTCVAIGNALNGAVRRPRALCVAMLFAMLFWVASFLNYYGYAAALDMQVPLLFYVVAISFASIVAFLPISINGFGVRESALVLTFSTIHVPATTSLLLALLMDAQVLLFGVIGGCLYLGMSREATVERIQAENENGADTLPMRRVSQHDAGSTGMTKNGMAQR